MIDFKRLEFRSLPLLTALEYKYWWFPVEVLTIDRRSGALLARHIDLGTCLIWSDGLKTPGALAALQMRR